MPWPIGKRSALIVVTVFRDASSNLGIVKLNYFTHFEIRVRGVLRRARYNPSVPSIQYTKYEHDCMCIETTHGCVDPMSCQTRISYQAHYECSTVRASLSTRRQFRATIDWFFTTRGFPLRKISLIPFDIHWIVSEGNFVEESDHCANLNVKTNSQSEEWHAANKSLVTELQEQVTKTTSSESIPCGDQNPNGDRL